MSILDFIFGGQDTSGDTKSKTATSTVEDSSKLIGQDQVQATSTRGDTEATTTNRTTGTTGGSLYTPAEQAALDALIQKSAGVNNVYGADTKAAVAGQGNVAAGLESNFANVGGNLDANIAAAKGAATLKYNEDVQPGIQHYSDLIGSSGNSTVQLMKLKGERDLQTQLMGVEADWRQKSQDQATQAGAVAADAATKYATGSAGFDAGAGEALKNALAAITTAKGGQYSTTADTLASGAASTKTLEDKLVEAILAERDDTTLTSDVTQKSSGSTSGSSSGSLPGLLGSLGSLGSLLSGPSHGPVA